MGRIKDLVIELQNEYGVELEASEIESQEIIEKE